MNLLLLDDLTNRLENNKTLNQLIELIKNKNKEIEGLKELL
jgi:hypothetical protein